MDHANGSGIKGPAYASLALAFASFGDAFLYPFLPVNASVVGVPVMWVGILLSVNRFVRIFSNGIMLRFFAKYGLRRVMILAVCLAILSTGGYTISSTAWVWLVFRICWGISFSAMRLGALGYALSAPRQGFVLGISRSLQEAGPMVALILSPILLNYFGARSIFLLLALLSIPGIYFAFALPRVDDKTQSLQNKKLHFPSTFNLITFVSAVLIDGMIVVILGILFLNYRDNITLFSATALAAFYLGYRRVCLVVFSPAGGWVADRFGLDLVFKGSMIFVVVGLLLLISGYIATGAVVIFTFYSVNSAITPGTVSKGHSDSLTAVAKNSTWRDVGAAIGTLGGGMLIASSHLTPILSIVIFGLIALLLIHFGKVHNTLKPFYRWR
jgi:MFS transporter, DHA1 family, multidrug resistance protein